MRNFSHVSSVQFQSYTIGWGEYVKDVSTTDVVYALAAAMEIDPSLLMSVWMQEACQGIEWSRHISSSEYEVLTNLYAFARFVILSIEEDGKTTASKVFTYINFNTGKSVTWTHTVC